MSRSILNANSALFFVPWLDGLPMRGCFGRKRKGFRNTATTYHCPFTVLKAM